MIPADHCIMGVDPGVTGGLAWLYPDGRVVAEDIPVADGEVDVDAIARRIRSYEPRLAIIERGGAMPKQGVSSTFKFGMAYGALRACVAVCEIPTVIVTAGKWKRHFTLDSDKEKSRAMAIRLWPGCGLFERKKDHGRAEAALIARYGSEVFAASNHVSAANAGARGLDAHQGEPIAVQSRSERREG